MYNLHVQPDNQLHSLCTTYPYPSFLLLAFVWIYFLFLVLRFAITKPLVHSYNYDRSSNTLLSRRMTNHETRDNPLLVSLCHSGILVIIISVTPLLVVNISLCCLCWFLYALPSYSSIHTATSMIAPRLYTGTTTL